MGYDRTPHRGGGEPPVLTDGTVVLRCLTPGDAAAHLAGEDGDQVRWLSGRPGSPAAVSDWIAANREQWRSGGPRRNLGVWDRRTGRLAGNVEAHLALDGLAPGEVNLAYAVFPGWRGRGLAGRAVVLLCDWLRSTGAHRTAVIRVEPANRYSHGVPGAAGFVRSGPVAGPDGRRLLRYDLPL